MSVVLVVNSGSSSFKYQLIDMDAEAVLASGLVERIGEDVGRSTHTVIARAHGDADDADATYSASCRSPTTPRASRSCSTRSPSTGRRSRSAPPVAVGHRVVHGGARFFEPTAHHPARRDQHRRALGARAAAQSRRTSQGIVGARRRFPDVPHVAVFDTAFHQTLPPAAYTYAIDRGARARRTASAATASTARRTSSSREAAAAFLGRPLGELHQIVLHLGNGASVARDRRRSLGRHLDGPDAARGTRDGHPLRRHRPGGAVAPRAPRRACRSTTSTTLLNRAAGCWASPASPTCATSDARVERGDDRRRCSRFEVYVHRLRTYVGAYLAQLGGVDVISFTAGVGENAPVVRAARARRPWASPVWRSTPSATRRAGAASASSPRMPRA